MIFKTLTLEIYRPSKYKRGIIDTAMMGYSRALEWLLEHYRSEISQLAACGASVTRKSLLTLPDKASLKELNTFDVEPFKDSLKIEFASIASAYIAQSRHGLAGFPCVTLDDEQYHARMDALIASYTSGEISKKQFIKSETGLIAHVNRVHMLYFGRYSISRDYCLMYDGVTGRFYVKLYLLNQSNRIARASETSPKDLKYVAPGMPAAEPEKTGRRYLVMPLAFGNYQLSQLKRALINPSILHTARIVKRGKHYYLLLNIECEQGTHVNTVTTMGVARSESGLHYTIPGRESGRIQSNFHDKSGLYIISAHIVKKALKYRCQVVLEANGGKNDAVMKCKKPAPFSVTEYSNLSKILAYKLPEAGLPAPIEVSANGLNNTCPRCSFKTYKNRISNHIFACIGCGYACLTEDVGSAELAGRLDKYKKDRIPIYFEQKEKYTIYYNKALDFECAMNVKDSDFTQLYYQLNLLAHSNSHCGNDMRKYSMVKKLREAENVSDVIRLVAKTHPQ